MSKSLFQIIPLLIKIEENFSRLYSNVASIEGQYNPSLRSAALVLSRQERDHAQKYRDLQNSLNPKDLEVEDGVYNAILAQVNTFMHSMQKENFKEPSDFLHYAIMCEKKTGDLLRSIKLLQLTPEVDELIDELIVAEDSHSSALAQFL